MSAAELCCPICAAELSIEQLFVHAETRQAFARLATLSLPLGSKVLAYVNLFAPEKNRMTIPRKVKLIEQLLPDLVRGAIDRRGREWQVSHDDWRNAIDQILAARDAGKLTLPLTSHGYLFEILATLADKVEAAAERESELQRRERTGQVSSTAPSGAVPVGTLVEHALQRQDRAVVPPPENARALLASLRRGMADPSSTNPEDTPS